MYKPKQQSLSHAPYQHLNLLQLQQHQPKPQTKPPPQQRLQEPHQQEQHLQLTPRNIAYLNRYVADSVANRGYCYPPKFVILKGIRAGSSGVEQMTLNH